MRAKKTPKKPAKKLPPWLQPKADMPMDESDMPMKKGKLPAKKQPPKKK